MLTPAAKTVVNTWRDLRIALPFRKRRRASGCGPPRLLESTGQEYVA
jgi:hypothetical protein